MKRKTYNWVDYTRRNDPAQPFFVNHLDLKLTKHGFPHVVCFWTKSPSKIAILYKDIIKKMQDNNVLTLLQATVNNYELLESNISYNDVNMDELIPLLGGSDHVRLRFDPIIPGYTKYEHYINVLTLAKKYGITRITTNFIVPSYKGISSVLNKMNIRSSEATEDEKINVLGYMVNLAKDYGVTLTGCAELNRDGIIDKVSNLLKSGCADSSWAEEIRPDLIGIFKTNPSRPGCLCCYDDDWGVYVNNGGPQCPHKCKYCYAK